MRALNDPDQGEVGVVHVFGEAAFPFAMECARIADAPLVVGINSEKEARSLAARADMVQDRARLLVLAADPIFLPALIAPLGGAECRAAAIGVLAPPAPRSILEGPLRPTLILSGSAQHAQPWSGALSALQQVVAAGADILAFADARQVALSGAWRAIESLGLSDRVSLIADAEAGGEAILAADILLRTEPTGSHTSFLLDAMASGMVVVTVPEPALPFLAGGETAILVHDTSASGWKRALDSILGAPESARAVALRAHQYVRREHRASAEVSAVLDAYEWLRTGRSGASDEA